MSSDRLRWNTPAVTCETFDDEVVIVNFDDGKYHSLQGTARLLWQRLESPVTIEELQRFAVRRFEAPDELVETEVRGFVTSLLSEKLVVPTSTVGTAPGDEQDGQRIAYVRPELHTFSDMQDLLWLDPIHEVDEAGWPVAKTEDTTDA